MTKQQNKKTRKITKTSTLIWTSVIGYALVFIFSSYIGNLLSKYGVNTIYMVYGLLLFIAGLPAGYVAARSSKTQALRVLGMIGVSLLLVIPLLAALLLVGWEWSVAQI